MLVALVAVFAGTALVVASADALERQVAELDESETRLADSASAGGVGLAAIGLGVILALVGLIVYLISTSRARKHAVARPPAPRIFALVGTFGIAFAILFLVASPTGPLAKATAFANGGGGEAGAVQLETFDGNLTGATLAGNTNDEDVHEFTLVARDGTITLRLGAQGENVDPRAPAAAVAILEASDGNGGWREVVRTPPAGDETVEVARATYEGPMRLRVRLHEGTVGGVGYIAAVSFLPSRE